FGRGGGVAATIFSPRECVCEPLNPARAVHFFGPEMSAIASPAETLVDPASRKFYIDSMKLMRDGGVPFLVGGAYAFARYAGIERHTKDFDIFIRRQDYERAVGVLQRAGYETELTFPHWLGKAFHGDDFIDLIFSAGNGVAQVDDVWFEYA